MEPQSSDRSARLWCSASTCARSNSVDAPKGVSGAPVGSLHRLSPKPIQLTARGRTIRGVLFVWYAHGYEQRERENGSLYLSLLSLSLSLFLSFSRYIFFSRSLYKQREREKMAVIVFLFVRRVKRVKSVKFNFAKKARQRKSERQRMAYLLFFDEQTKCEKE